MGAAGPTSPSGEPAGPLVGIVMGSASDLEIMRPAIEALEALGIISEVRVVSAHRTPLSMVDYGRTAADRGLRVIVAGAGGAAHLPGMLASLTDLPVIGVPVPLRHLGGLDSLLSMVQMPAGVPVATVAVGGAHNAGLLAARILALGDGSLTDQLAHARAERAALATAQDEAVQTSYPTGRQVPAGAPPPPA